MNGSQVNEHLARFSKKMASAVAGSIAGSIGSSLLGFGANLLTSKGRTGKTINSKV